MKPILLNLRVCISIVLGSLVALPLRADATKDWSAIHARTAAAWVRGAVVYEIFPRQFSQKGDFAGITGRLDELKALGVDVLWLMPVHPLGRLKAKGSIGSPYAVQDYYGVNPDYGTKDDLHRLIDGAHARGMKVIIDMVANHTAWDSVMMSNPRYYKQDKEGHVIPPNPDWTDVAGLNYGNPETRRYMSDMMQYWVREFQLDGFRCDAAGEVPTDFWEQLRQDLDKVRPGPLPPGGERQARAPGARLRRRLRLVHARHGEQGSDGGGARRARCAAPGRDRSRRHTRSAPSTCGAPTTTTRPAQ